MNEHPNDLLQQYPADRDAGLTEEVDEERFRGYAGGFIEQHRALTLEPHDRKGLVVDVLLALVLAEAWWLSVGWVARFWAELLQFWREVFGLAGYVVVVDYSYGLQVPYMAVPSWLPGTWEWLGGAGLVVALLIVSLLLPRRLLPVSYFLRIVAGFQAVAQVYFAFWAESFPYDIGGYVHGMLFTGIGLNTLIPILLGFSFFVFDFGIGRKVGLTLLVITFFTILFPLQYMAHALALHYLSLLYLPLLFFVLGLPVDVVLFIAFYGWGVSWKSRWHTRTEGPAPRLAIGSEVVT